MEEKTVLVIEESSVVSDLVRDLLEAAGFGVVQASTSRDGLLLLDEKKFHVVVVDIDMPHISGWDVLSKTRGMAHQLRTPILFLTARGAHAEIAPENCGEVPDDFIQTPVDPVDLILRVRGAVGQSSPATPVPQVASPHPAQSPLVREDRPQAPSLLARSITAGKIITVFSLKGGVGTSMIAVNLAVALRRLWEEPVALVDLSLEAGALNILLDLMPTSTIDQLVEQNGNVTPELIVQYLVPHKSGLNLLSAPSSPERAEIAAGPSLRHVLSVMSEAHDYVVIDTASNFAEYTLMALEMADTIVMPLIGDIASIRATTTSLDIFEALKMAENKIVPVFNEITPKVGLSRKNVETSLKLSLTPIPPGGARVVESINLGTPLVVSHSDCDVAIAIENLAYEISRSESKDKFRPKPTDRLSKLKKRLKV